MTRTTMLSVAAVLAWIAAAGAQTQQQTQAQPPEQRTQPPASSAAVQTVMLVGCIEPGASANAFMLNVTEQSGATASTAAGRQPDAAVSGQARVGEREVGITGEAQVGRRDPQPRGTAGTNFVGQRLQLIGDERANLKAHVGHQVEITGMLAPQAKGTGGQTAAETRLNVSNVRMISGKCAVSTSGAVSGRPAGSVSQPQTQPGTAGTSGTAGTTGATGTTGTTVEQSEPTPQQKEQQERREQQQ